MILVQILMAFLVALLVSAILVWVVGRRGPGPLTGFLFFLALLFFAVWAGGVWIEPIGPEVWGVSWLVMLVVGLLVALIIVLVSPPAPPPGIAPDEEGVMEPSAAGWGCDLLFWITIAVLMLAAVARYTWFYEPPPP